MYSLKNIFNNLKIVASNDKYGSDKVAYQALINNDLVSDGKFYVKIKAAYRPIEDNIQTMSVFADHTGNDGLK